MTDPSPPQKSLQGQLLLDGGQLVGSFFHRGVVLVCRHDVEGAFGLVLNRTTGKEVAEVILEDLSETLKEEPVFLGGPVQPTSLSFLHTDQFDPHANVMQNLNVGHSMDGLIELGESY
ncbi:MAG TPA: YqgE/AlgH family protein, partial [Methylomirabilota bacterium]|nr:YqgE/AlgH family protein [Methylomirabilota bacterium]